jgi:RNA polymerase sigma factor (sigma-70 family)
MQVDRPAFAQIVERYQRVVYAVAYAATRDRALADDLAQDTFVVAWHRLDSLRDATRLPAWLCGIARNLARDALKRRRREREHDAIEVVDPATPFDALSDAESERLVAAALAAIPDVYREPLVLFYVEHRSVEDVASALGLTAHTTNKRLSRGRQHLAARVEELVARKLEGRGPRRDLVPCVLAAIDAPGSDLHVDTTAIAKGSIMLKLAVPALLVATVGGAGLLFADATTPKAAAPSPARTRSTPIAVKPASTIVAPIAKPHATPAKPATTAPVSAPAAPRLPSATPRAATCAAVAQRLAEVRFDGFSSAKQMPAAKRQLFITARSSDLRKRCDAERWSEDRRICLMSATDSTDELACAEDMIATAEELAALPRELQCDAVAKHLTELATAPGAKFDVVAKKMAAMGKPFDLEQVKVQVRDQTRAQCDELPWSKTLRSCIVASKTHDDQSACW